MPAHGVERETRQATGVSLEGKSFGAVSSPELGGRVCRRCRVAQRGCEGRGKGATLAVPIDRQICDINAPPIAPKPRAEILRSCSRCIIITIVATARIVAGDCVVFDAPFPFPSDSVSSTQRNSLMLRNDCSPRAPSVAPEGLGCHATPVMRSSCAATDSSDRKVGNDHVLMRPDHEPVRSVFPSGDTAHEETGRTSPSSELWIAMRRRVASAIGKESASRWSTSERKSETRKLLSAARDERRAYTAAQRSATANLRLRAARRCRPYLLGERALPEPTGPPRTTRVRAPAWPPRVAAKTALSVPGGSARTRVNIRRPPKGRNRHGAGTECGGATRALCLRYTSSPNVAHLPPASLRGVSEKQFATLAF